MNKRGLSEIVIVILIILIGIIAVLILFPIIKNFILKTTSNINPEQFTISLAINKPVTISQKLSNSIEINNNITIHVKREVGEGKILKIKFVIENSTLSKNYDYSTNITELNSKTFNIIDSNVTAITKISIVPVIDKNGEEKLGIVADIYENK